MSVIVREQIVDERDEGAVPASLEGVLDFVTVLESVQ